MTHRPFTADDLSIVGELLCGPQWQRSLARLLGMNERTLRRYAGSGDTPLPDWLPVRLAFLLRRHAEQCAAEARRMAETWPTLHGLTHTDLERLAWLMGDAWMTEGMDREWLAKYASPAKVLLDRCMAEVADARASGRMINAEGEEGHFEAALAGLGDKQAIEVLRAAMDLAEEG